MNVQDTISERSDSLQIKFAKQILNLNKQLFHLKLENAILRVCLKTLEKFAEIEKKGYGVFKK